MCIYIVAGETILFIPFGPVKAELFEYDKRDGDEISGFYFIYFLSVYTYYRYIFYTFFYFPLLVITISIYI